MCARSVWVACASAITGVDDEGWMGALACVAECAADVAGDTGGGGDACWRGSEHVVLHVD